MALKATSRMKRIKGHQESQMKKLFAHFLRDESGVTAIEYGLIAGLISVVIVVAVTSIGGNLQTVFQTIADKLAGT